MNKNTSIIRGIIFFTIVLFLSVSFAQAGTEKQKNREEIVTKNALQIEINNQQTILNRLCGRLSRSSHFKGHLPPFCRITPPATHANISLALSVNPGQVLIGEIATLSWKSSGATYCKATNGWNGTKPQNGTEAVTVLNATAYTISCGNSFATSTAQVTVNITPITAQPACSDGIDNDGDTKIDYPADPGCTGQTDTNESTNVQVSVHSSETTPSQNISTGVPGQPLGGYDIDVKDQPISVDQHIFSIATSSTGAGFLTNIQLVNESGIVVAGPVDTFGDGTSIVFTDTVTYPVGKHTFKLVGKLPAGFNNGGTIVVSTTPSSQWSSATSLSALNTKVSMSPMNVKTGSLSIGVSSSPATQNIASGGQVTFANYQFDTSQSGEDVRFSSIPLQLTFGGGAVANSLTSCQLFDGATVLNTGSNIVNPSSSLVTGSSVGFTLDSSFVIPKETVKTLALKCTVSSFAVNGSTFSWGISSAPLITVTGVTSGSDITETVTAGIGQIMTVATGALYVAVDPSTPAYTIASGGTTGINMAVIKLRATNESINLTKVGLKLTSGLPSDLNTVYLYQGSTLIGTAVFTGSNTTATSTLNSALLLPNNTDVLITIKADLASIGTGQLGTEGGLIKIDPLNAEGSGMSSGNTIQAGSATTGVAGIRMFKSFPVLARGSLSGTGMADGKLMRFKVTANSNGGIGLNQFKFTIATSSGISVTGVNLYGYTDYGYSTGISGFTSGQLMTSNVTGATGAVTVTPSAVINVQAGTTYYFELRGTVTGTVTGSSVITTLLGDSAYPSLAANMGTSGAVVTAGGNLVWSPNATTTSAAAHVDWTNGYGVIGLPSTGLNFTRVF